jgi:predicted deacylase
MGDPALPIEELVEAPSDAAPAGEPIGESRRGRPIHAHRLGSGPARVSLIGGCHADEPVGPEMLRRLVGWLSGLPEDHRLLSRMTWLIVPHVNPDGERRNAAWAGELVETRDHLGRSDRGFDLGRYLTGEAIAAPGRRTARSRTS